MELPERKIYTVSELTEQIRELLEREYPSVWVQGEVSNLRVAPSGHLYFSLKDETSQIRCVMFKTQSRFLKFRLEDGLNVVAWGRLSVYTVRGEYQLILDTIEPLGLGSLMLAFEQLRAKLASEGLFDSERKKPIPRLPSTVGLVTSPRGAAVRDMIRIITRRFPAVNIVVSPTSVQGDKAPQEIVQAIDRLCQVRGVDVIIVGRGGGSIEDLWAFNDEMVVKAVAQCPLPTVSAVGHETDVTLTDFAADLRASTPSAAAELVVPSRQDLAESVLHLNARLRSSIRHSFARNSAAVNEALKRLYDPRRQIQDKRMRIDELSMRLGNAVVRKLSALRQEIRGASERLRPAHLRRTIDVAKHECHMLSEDLGRSMREILNNARSAVETVSLQLESLSPLAVLSRGYSITFRPDTGTIISDSQCVQMGEDVRIRLHRGELSCTVTGAHVSRDEVP